MLKIENLVKEFSPGIRVNDDISVDIEQGEIFGLFGPNGAGKTTLVSQIIGFIKPTQGKITINGIDVVKKPHVARQLCSLQPQSQISINGLTPMQAIELSGRIRKGDKKEVKQRTKFLLDQLDLGKWANTKSENLSGGIRRLVTFCMAAIVPGNLVILDEPTNDVDPVRRKLLWEQIQNLADLGVSVFLVSHNILEAEKYVNRLSIIDNGKLIALGTPSSLKMDLNDKLRIELSHGLHDKITHYPEYVSLLTDVRQNKILSIPQEMAKEGLEWVTDLQENGKIDEFSLSAFTLEDAYLHVVGNSKEKVGMRSNESA